MREWKVEFLTWDLKEQLKKFLIKNRKIAKTLGNIIMDEEITPSTTVDMEQFVIIEWKVK